MDFSADTAQEDQEAKISSYEEALAKIKDATGVSDIQEVVDRFLTQGDTKRHLEQLREENSHQLARLKEEKGRLQVQFEDMKYSGEAKMSTYVSIMHVVCSHGGVVPSLHHNTLQYLQHSCHHIPAVARGCSRTLRDTWMMRRRGKGTLLYALKHM